MVSMYCNYLKAGFMKKIIKYHCIDLFVNKSTKNNDRKEILLPFVIYLLTQRGYNSDVW